MRCRNSSARRANRSFVSIKSLRRPSAGAEAKNDDSHFNSQSTGKSAQPRRVARLCKSIRAQ
jgi:hypothetical protein